MATSEQTGATIARRAVARIDLDAIAANCVRLRAELSDGAQLCAVVKADGYGHGIAQAARAAARGGATRLAVVTADEAALLAAENLDLPLLVMAPLESDQLPMALAAGAEISAWTIDQVAEAEAAAAAAGIVARVHVKLDTGMGRFGAKTSDQAYAALDLINRSESLAAAGVWTHFATADQDDDDFFELQLARFSEFARVAKERYPGLLVHAANSAATLRSKASHFDFVRCGIAIYGLDPANLDASNARLRPALSLHSYVASIRPLAAGESTGYGRRFIAERDLELATIPIGYGDGWRRALSNNSAVLIGGRRMPQRGTISMDSIAVEIVGGVDVAIGDPVVLIGRDGDQAITAEDVANQSATINYEIVCGLTPRTVRSYLQPS